MSSKSFTPSSLQSVSFGKQKNNGSHHPQDKTQIPYNVFLKPNPAYFTTLIPQKLSEAFYSPSTLILPDYAHAYLPFLFMPFFGLSFHSVRMMNL